LVVVLVRARPAEPLALRQDIVAIELGMRGGAVAIGDHLRVVARTGSRRHAALRIYLREREVVLECPGGSSCSSSDGQLAAEVTLSVPGSYRALVIAGAGSVPPATGSLDADARAAESAGLAMELGQTVTVR
jgi:hypothetical protein